MRESIVKTNRDFLREWIDNMREKIPLMSWVTLCWTKTNRKSSWYEFLTIQNSRKSLKIRALATKSWRPSPFLKIPHQIWWLILYNKLQILSLRKYWLKKTASLQLFTNSSNNQNLMKPRMMLVMGPLTTLEIPTGSMYKILQSSPKPRTLKCIHQSQIRIQCLQVLLTFKLNPKSSPSPILKRNRCNKGLIIRRLICKISKYLKHSYNSNYQMLIDYKENFI